MDRNFDIHITSVTGDEVVQDSIKLLIKNGAINLKLDAVIWTSLPSKFNGQNNEVPTLEKAIAYLNSLDINTR